MVVDYTSAGTLAVRARQLPCVTCQIWQEGTRMLVIPLLGHFTLQEMMQKCNAF